MNRFILFLLLFAACSYSTDINACIVLPSNTVNVGGPTSVCASDPSGSYGVSYSTGIDDPYELVIVVQSGTVSNVQGYSSVGGVPSPGSCVPTLLSEDITDCFHEMTFEVLPACRGGVTFDVDWSDDCPMGEDDNFIEGLLYWDGDFVGDAEIVSVNPNCFGGGGDTQGLGSMGGSVDQSEEGFAVDIFPNPATGSNVTISLPSDYDNCEVNVLDVNGKLIQSYSNVNEQLLVNTSEMNGNFYFIQVITADGVVDTQKLMLAK